MTSSERLLRGAALAFSLSLAVTLGACQPQQPTTLADATCPEQGTALTYQNFGEGFFTVWCQGCHGAPLGQRNGAKVEHDFGSYEGVLAFKERIFANAAADNVAMPPGPRDPSPAERDELGEWLACGAPR